MTIIQDKYIVQNPLKTMFNGTSINTCPHLAYTSHTGFVESKLPWILPKKDGRKQMERRYKPKHTLIMRHKRGQVLTPTP